MARVLKFYADWCQPCKALSKMLEEIKTEVSIEEIDIDDKTDIAREYGIRSVPTLVMLDGNTEIKRKTGTMPKKDLEEWLNV